MAARIGTSEWVLINLSNSRTASPCDHCDRAVKRGFIVRHDDGHEIRVGCGCVKKLTGWTLEWAEAQQKIRCAILTERSAIVRTEFPGLWGEQPGGVVAQPDYKWENGTWRDMAAWLTKDNERRRGH